jgi:hypothetical protein
MGSLPAALLAVGAVLMSPGVIAVSAGAGALTRVTTTK